MFGSLRFFLTYLVVLSHLVGSGVTHHLGTYAVCGFFVVSGFVITLALNELYRFDGVRFATNRLLRLLPPYYIVCAATLAVIGWFPDATGAFMKLWQPEVRAADVLMNLLVLPMEGPDLVFRIVPPYWSVAIEFVMYFMLWLVIGRRMEFAVVMVVAGIAYHAFALGAGWPWEARYFTSPSALLAFSLGALVYFLRQGRHLGVGPRTAAVAFVFWLANLAVAVAMPPDAYLLGAGFYIGILCFVAIVAGLADCKLPVWAGAIDDALGTLAYPVFLLHWLVAFGVHAALLPANPRGWTLTLVATPPLLVAAYGLAHLHERLIEPLRRRVRRDAVAGVEAGPSGSAVVA